MLQVVDVDGVEQTWYEHMLGRLPGWTEHMQIAGMAGYGKTHTTMTPKPSPRRKKCLFVCYAEYHASDCSVMYDPRKRSILHSRDVLWLNKTYFKPNNLINEDANNPPDEGSEDWDIDSCYKLKLQEKIKIHFFIILLVASIITKNKNSAVCFWYPRFDQA